MTDKKEDKKEEPQKEESKLPSLLEETRQAIEELKAANAEKKALLVREEKLRADELLGGKTLAGEPSEKPKELTPREYKDKVLAGEINGKK